jgi:multicomponent Na+:H+ antiporter subunit G
MIQDVVATGLLVAGGAFMLLAAVAVLRMPDLYMRMSATTKAGTMGMGLLLLGTVVHFGEVEVAIRAAAVIFFGFLTAPVAAHLIARAAFFSDVPLWDGSVINQLRIDRLEAASPKPEASSPPDATQ